MYLGFSRSVLKCLELIRCFVNTWCDEGLCNPNMCRGIACVGGDYAFVSFLLVVILLLTTTAYFAFTSSDKRLASAIPSQSSILISCSMGQLAVSLQVPRQGVNRASLFFFEMVCATPLPGWGNLGFQGHILNYLYS